MGLIAEAAFMWKLDRDNGWRGFLLVLALDECTSG